MKEIYLIPEYGNMERSLALAEEYGCAFEYNDFYNPAVLDDPEEQEKIIQYYAKYRTDFSEDTLHGAFLDVTVHSSDPLIRQASELRVRQSMEIAKRMGVRGVVFHTGRLAGFRVDYYLKQWMEMNLAFFKKLAEEYPKQQIFMENMFDEAPDVLAEFAKRMAEHAEGFGVCLDYAHSALTDCAQEEWIRTLAPWIRHMHINDNDLENDLHSPVGTGRIDWRHYNELVDAYAVNASVLVEVKGYEAQKKSLEYMSRNGIYPFCKKDKKNEKEGA